MIYPDEQVEGEFKPTTIGQSLNDSFMIRLEMAAQISRFTESPIETMFGLAMLERIHDPDWELIPQLIWGRYRIDWVLRRDGKPDIFIECDGNEFHTSELAVARDKRRDAEIVAAGIKVIRFTGSEIFNDAAGCANQIYREAML